eukprot:COSAG01_NODE_246_length_20450_cov_195.166822_13_plen_158_part_00
MHLEKQENAYAARATAINVHQLVRQGSEELSHADFRSRLGVSRPFPSFSCGPLWLRFTYVTPVLVMKLRMETQVRLGRLGPQSFFGELAIMSAQTAGGGGGAGMGCGLRTRSVVSRGPCHFHVLTKHAVDELRAELPPLERVSGDACHKYVYGCGWR